jgi:hypothetical protein
MLLNSVKMGSNFFIQLQKGRLSTLLARHLLICELIALLLTVNKPPRGHRLASDISSFQANSGIVTRAVSRPLSSTPFLAQCSLHPTILIWVIPVCCSSYGNNKHSLTHHSIYLFCTLCYFTLRFSQYTTCFGSAEPKHVVYWENLRQK